MGEHVYTVLLYGRRGAWVGRQRRFGQIGVARSGIDATIFCLCNFLCQTNAKAGLKPSRIIYNLVMQPQFKKTRMKILPFDYVWKYYALITYENTTI